MTLHNKVYEVEGWLTIYLYENQGKISNLEDLHKIHEYLADLAKELKTEYYKEVLNEK